METLFAFVLIGPIRCSSLMIVERLKLFEVEQSHTAFAFPKCYEGVAGRIEIQRLPRSIGHMQIHKQPESIRLLLPEFQVPIS